MCRAALVGVCGLEGPGTVTGPNADSRQSSGPGRGAMLQQRMVTVPA